MNVIAAWPGATRDGGGLCRADGGMTDGHAVRSRVRIHFSTSPNERPVTACGLKKWPPSQWSETGNRGTQNLYTRAVSSATSLVFTPGDGGRVWFVSSSSTFSCVRVVIAAATPAENV